MPRNRASRSADHARHDPYGLSGPLNLNNYKERICSYREQIPFLI